MPNYLFKMTSNARDASFVVGIGADRDAALADAQAKWDAVYTDPNQLPRFSDNLVAVSSDAPEDLPSMPLLVAGS